MTKKVAVIGLDGIGWPILNRVFEHGAMPALQKLVEKSIRGVLKSIVPVTPPAWTSIATGVNPGKHGVFDFVTFSGGYETRIVNSLDVHYPRIHEMIALKGLKSVCINFPLTYPIIRIENSMVISDGMAPKVSYYPKLLKKYVTDYPLHTPISHFENKAALLKGLYAEVSARTKVVQALMENIDWDLFWIVYSESDPVLHKCYNEIWNGDEEALKLFEKFDGTIKKASELTDLTIIVSDHGFSTFNYLININSFLNKLGLITKTWEKTMRGFTDFKPNMKTERVRLSPKIYKIASIRPIKTLIKILFKTFSGKEIKAELPYVDPEASKAFMSSNMSFGIHVKEQSFMDFIIEELKMLEGIDCVWRKEEIYSGPFAEKAPEILFLPDFNKGYSMGTTMLHPKVITKGVSYWHHPDGVIIIISNKLTPTWLEQAKTVDIVPTILNYLGLPIPSDTDGKPMPNVTPLPKRPKHYNYLKHWQLIKQVQTAKIRLAKQI